MSKAKKEKLKEAEAESEAEGCKKEISKKPMEEEDGKLVKDAEAESEAECKKEAEDEAGSEEEDEDDSCLDETEKATYRSLKAKIRKAGTSQDPVQSAANSQDASHTTSPGASTPSSPQNVFVPPSNVSGKREQSTPMDGMKKSAEPDLMKSPLFVGVSKQLDGIQDALGKKIDALEKSVNDRLKNVKADMDKIEKFYNQSFYKAAPTEAGPQVQQQQPIRQMLEEGKVKYSP